MNCPNCGAENRPGARFCDSCGTALAAAPAEQRKLVTVVFCDVSGSTALGERLDPEAVRATMSRYFDTARAAIERHGGTVEKFIGDAVMAVFGVPQVHEDDALRAVRAAFEICERVAVDVRIGINSGEVVTGAAGTLVTGDAVNVAARLEQAASPGEVILGVGTQRLVRGAVEVELLPPLEVKGKSEPLTAYRALGVLRDEIVAPRFEAPLVGRERESRLLADAWERVRAERACLLFTIVGPPGVGKSRVARAFVDSVSDARVVTGRCLSYGEGITFWPVVEVVKQLLRGVEPQDRAIAALLGDGNASLDEIGFSVRKLFEATAGKEPLVVVLDDVHWGEAAFFDLIEDLADLSRGAPILLLCLARPDLLDRRPGWAGGKLNATTLLLEPLDERESDELVEHLLGGATLTSDLRARILTGAEGNPLFVEEMLAMVEESGSWEIAVPPTIQALLAARIDQLAQSERATLERGSVEGQVFHRGAVQALAGDDSRPDRDLAGLVRKEFVRPTATVLAGDEAFRFRHLLIRDGAYNALPKATRAELHERFVIWLEEYGADLVELDEVLGYHLEAAAAYHRELELPDRPLSTRASAHLGRAGIRAFDRLDFHAARNLLERAVELADPNDPSRVPLVATLAETVYAAGDLDLCGRLLAETFESGTQLGVERSVIRAEIFRLFVEAHRGGTITTSAPRLDMLIEELERSGDVENLVRALTANGWLRFWLGNAAIAVDLGLRAVELATQAGVPQLEAEAAGLVGAAMHYGSTPWSELTAFLEERLARSDVGQGGRLGTSLLDHRNAAEYSTGRFDEARERYAAFDRSLIERGMEMFSYTVGMSSGQLELYARDFPAAERILRRAWQGLAEAGEGGFRSQVGAELAEALAAQGRLAEATAVLDESERIVAEDDISSLSDIATKRTLVATREGRHADAVRWGRRAVALGDTTDYSALRTHSRVALGEALLRAGDRAAAERVLDEAVDEAERKGSSVVADAARELLASAEIAR